MDLSIRSWRGADGNIQYTRGTCRDHPHHRRARIWRHSARYVYRGALHGNFSQRHTLTLREYHFHIFVQTGARHLRNVSNCHLQPSHHVERQLLDSLVQSLRLNQERQWLRPASVVLLYEFQQGAVTIVLDLDHDLPDLAREVRRIGHNLAQLTHHRFWSAGLSQPPRAPPFNLHANAPAACRSPVLAACATRGWRSGAQYTRRSPRARPGRVRAASCRWR